MEMQAMNLSHFKDPNSKPSTVHTTPIDLERLKKAKAAYTTRRAPLDRAVTLLHGDIAPTPGDLVLAQVAKIGQHTRIELGNGRRAPLFLGDEVVVCYGHRYAPDQYEAEVPSSLAPCDLVAAGGIAAQALAKHGGKKAPTRIRPVGLLGDEYGQPINLADWALPTAEPRCQRPLTFAVAGTSMNAGKTTSAAYLIKGLVHSGLKVGAAKLTGTGSGGDAWLMIDAGAAPVVDFTDAGFATTHRISFTELEGIFTTLIRHLADAAVDAIVFEVADGLFQRETAALLSSSVFKESVDGMIFAARDAMGAVGGVNWLLHRNLPVMAVSGAVTASPLASREIREAVELPVLGLDQLSDPDILEKLAERPTNCIVSKKAS